MAPIEKTKQLIKKLPEQKPHLDFIAALLTIPVLITVLLINLSSINNKKSTTAQPTPTVSVMQPTQNKNNASRYSNNPVNPTDSPTPNPNSCVKGIGQIEVSYPQEGQIVSDNPLCISIDYSQGDYCSVVWAYKINNGNFSDYSNNSVCLYNVLQGDNTFILQVKSLVNTDTKVIQRHFTYKNTQVSATPSPNASPSAS